MQLLTLKLLWVMLLYHYVRFDHMHIRICLITTNMAANRFI